MSPLQYPDTRTEQRDYQSQPSYPPQPLTPPPPPQLHSPPPPPQLHSPPPPYPAPAMGTTFPFTQSYPLHVPMSMPGYAPYPMNVPFPQPPQHPVTGFSPTMTHLSYGPYYSVPSSPSPPHAYPPQAPPSDNQQFLYPPGYHQPW